MSVLLCNNKRKCERIKERGLKKTVCAPQIHSWDETFMDLGTTETEVK